MTDDRAITPPTALAVVQRYMKNEEDRRHHLEGHRTLGRLRECRICHALEVERREATIDMLYLVAAIERHDADREDGTCHAPLTYYVEEQAVFDGK